MKKLIIITIVALFTTTVFADNEKASFTTSAQCEMCIENITEAITSLDGVKKVMMTEVSKEVKVKFDNDVVSLSEIKQAVANVGYTAGDVQPTKETVEALAPCCKPGKACGSEAKKSCDK